MKKKAFNNNNIPNLIPPPDDDPMMKKLSTLSTPKYRYRYRTYYGNTWTLILNIYYNYNNLGTVLPSLRWWWSGSLFHTRLEKSEIHHF